MSKLPRSKNALRRGILTSRPLTRSALNTEIAERVQPEYLGLASEINTLAARGDPALYLESRDLVNTLPPRIRTTSPGTSVFVSFQADEANGAHGVIDPIIDHFALIDDYDIDALGLSSYPVFFFDTPADVPDDYFTVFDAATDLPLVIVDAQLNRKPAFAEWQRIFERPLDD